MIYSAWPILEGNKPTPSLVLYLQTIHLRLIPPWSELKHHFHLASNAQLLFLFQIIDAKLDPV